MDKAHESQKSKIQLDVGGHKFTTSRQTLTSVPDSYFASMFSGRFELATDDTGAYFIDRDGTHFRHILNWLRDCGSSSVATEEMGECERKELSVELAFYGLLDRMMPAPSSPYPEQDIIGQSFLERACEKGTKDALTSAVAMARALVFNMGCTQSFLAERYAENQWVVTAQVVNEMPVWTAKAGSAEELFMYCSSNKIYNHRYEE